MIGWYLTKCHHTNFEVIVKIALALEDSLIPKQDQDGFPSSLLGCLQLQSGE